VVNNVSLLQNTRRAREAFLTSYSIGIRGIIPGDNVAGTELTTHLHLVMRLKMSGVISPLPQCVFIVQTGTTVPLPEDQTLFNYTTAQVTKLA